MSELTLYQQNQIQEITTDAIEVIEAHPVARQHLSNLAESIGYLAYCAVKEQNNNHLGDIQALINTAKAGQSAELLKMNRQVQAEMQQLRLEMRLGFEALAQVLDTIDQRHAKMYDVLDERLRCLENQALVPPEPPVQTYYYHIDNSYTDNSRHSRSESNGGNVEALAWTIVAIFFTVLACSILPYSRR